MKPSTSDRTVGFVLVNPITGLYFDGVNFSATRGNAKVFSECPDMPTVRAVWPGARQEVVPSGETAFLTAEGPYYRLLGEHETVQPGDEFTYSLAVLPNSPDRWRWHKVWEDDGIIRVGRTLAESALAWKEGRPESKFFGRVRRALNPTDPR